MGYRTPRIEEFVEGFEYEVYSEGYFDGDLEELAGWYRYTVGVDSWRDEEEIAREIARGNVRVLITCPYCL